MSSEFNLNLSRRDLLKLLFLPLLGCEQSYERPVGLHDLGEVKELLNPTSFVRDKAFYLRRDDAGWSAMSTQCTYEGCQLSLQERAFICVCCRSIFDLAGRVARGPAKNNLPYYSIFYKDNHLYADTAEIVEASDRYTTPEIEQALAKLRERIQQEGARPGAQIPDILRGAADGDVREMFVEKADLPTPTPTIEPFHP